MTTVPPVHILILAAGLSQRMRGSDKLLQTVAGLPLLRHLALQALQTQCPVTVTLPPDRPLRLAALDGLGAARVTVADAATGMSASVRAGVRAIPDGAAILLLLADLPEITHADLDQMIRAQALHPDRILRGTDIDGQPGHPVLFPPDLRDALLQVSGDQGPREVLRAHAGRLHPVVLPRHHATTDLDTPEDWAAWRSRRD